MGLIQIAIAAMSSVVAAMPPQKEKADARLARFSSPTPNERAMELLAPMPKRLPVKDSIMKRGKHSVSAATWEASPVCPTKKVSAKLYINSMTWLKTVGPVRAATARGTGLDSNISVCLTSINHYNAPRSRNTVGRGDFLKTILVN